MRRLAVRVALAGALVALGATAAMAQQPDDPATRAMRHAEAAIGTAEVAPVREPVPGPGVEVVATDEAADSSLAPASTGREEIDRVVAEASARSGVDRRLVVALMRQESGFHGRAVSPKGAAGYMQLMPATARRFGVTDVFDARQNIHAGVRYLRLLLDMFGGDRKLALAAYNAGEGRVGSIIARTGVRQFDEMARRGLLPAETRAYVPAIMSRLARLGGPVPVAAAPLAARELPGTRVDAPASLAWSPER